MWAGLLDSLLEPDKGKGENYMGMLNRQVQGLFLAIERNCSPAVWRQFERDYEDHKSNPKSELSPLADYVINIIAYGLHHDPSEIRGMLMVPESVGEYLISAQNEPETRFSSYPCQVCGCLIPVRYRGYGGSAERIFTKCPSCHHVRYKNESQITIFDRL